MHEALFYRSSTPQPLVCELCPRACAIPAGKTGFCGVRRNVQGQLISENYNLLTAVQPDPVEKKPLYHFYPGSLILSAGSFGCNFHCSFCQNADISQASLNTSATRRINAIDLASQAREIPGNIGLAYTYNEPIVFIEYMLEAARLIRSQGMKNVMVTNGYINSYPLEKLLDVIDGFNVDLKFFSDTLYQKLCGGRLKPVLNTLKSIRKSGLHLEITHLVIPGQNDDEKIFRSMLEWISGELGKESILHLSRYFPRFQLHLPPTPEQKLIDLYHIASEKLSFVYLGNLNAGNKNHTLCPKCSRVSIRRSGYLVEIPGLDPMGRCTECGEQIALRS